MANLDVWQYIQEDGFLNQFLAKIDSKENITDLCKNVLSVTEVMEKLSAGIIQLDKALLQQVLDKNEVLMSQLDWIDKLGIILKDMTIRVQSLVQWVEQIKPKIVKPYHRLETQTLILARLHETCDLLRRALRIQQLAKRLPEQDPLKAAITISELEELSHDVDLSGLEILESENRLIKTEKVRVAKQASAMVSQGLLQLNQNQVSTGLEIQKKLGCVESEVQKIMEDRLQQIEESVQYALDVSNLVPQNRGNQARVSGSIPGNIQNFRSKLWSAWEHALNTTVYSCCAQMILVQSVLNNGVNGNNFNLGTTTNKSEIASTFWISVDNYLTKNLDQAAHGSSYIKQALEIEYPKLLRLHLDLHKQLKTLESDNENEVFPPLGNCVKLFEKAYLNRSLKLLLDAVRDTFPESEAALVLLPPIDKVDSLVKTISSELNVSLVDNTLSKPIASNISKAISLFCQKADKIVITGPDAVQFIDNPNEGQILNVNLANTVHYLCEQVRNVVLNLSLDKVASNIIFTSLEEGNKLIQTILHPFLDSISKAIESIILTMHNEDFNMKENGSSTSLYLRELKDFINRVVKTYLSQYHSQHIVIKMCLQVAHRCVELFIRHAVLIRPISEAGRKKLIADFKIIEEVVSPLCGRLTELGPSYSKLRSVRPLIISTPEDLASSPVLGHVIPHSLALTMLFSRAPAELPSPHQSVNWSVSQLSEWLDRQESERDRLEFLSGAMQKYEQTVVRSNQTPHPTYLIMKRLLEKAFTHLNNIA